LELERLIRKCLQHSQKAQFQLFEKYSDRLFVVAFSYLKNRFAAEEVIGNAFLKIFHSLEEFRFEGESKFEAWMRRIVVNEALMEIRKMKQIPPTSPDFPQNIATTESSDHLYFEELVQLIEGLPEGYRLVFKLYVIEGYSHSEIGDLLQISEGTSKSQLHKARLMLQQMLIKTEQNYG
jgi:RNA polymerase sigma-70 factor (ECF subfamily)